MHILFLTDNFPPEVNAPASRTFEHCREWVLSGHKVTVITCAPNFPKGKVFGGYRNKLWQTEIIDGINVIRVWTYITANEGFLKRIIDYSSYMMAATIAGPFVKKPDVVVATSPILFTAMAGYLVGKLHRKPFIFELRDIWPESIKAVGAMKDSVVIRFFEMIEMFLYRKSVKIISVTNSFKEKLIERGVPAGKIHIVTNGVDTSRYKPLPKNIELVKNLSLANKFVAGYIGTHGMAHALETLLKAADIISRNKLGKDIIIVFLGHGSTKNALLLKAKDLELKNVLFLDTVSKDDVPDYWSLLDVSIIHLRKTPLFTTVIPSKLFECMGMGIPILHGVSGESAEIVLKENVGIPFTSENHVELAERLIELKHNHTILLTLKKNCVTAAHKYERKNLAKKMLGLLEETVAINQMKNQELKK